MEHSSSLITESVCVAANGGCVGFFIIGGGATTRGIHYKQFVVCFVVQPI